MSTRNFFFIDSRVADYQSLIAGLPPDSGWALLTSQEDGLLQMQRVLQAYTNLDSVQIISHGSTGTLYLGCTVLNSENLCNYQSQLQAIGSSLTETGDILLYGCNVAQGDVGIAFVNSLANISGADVAASDDSTGLGGDAMLELKTGSIDAKGLDLDGLATALSGNTAPSFRLPGDGIVTTVVGSGGNGGESVTVQADGKILVAGYSNGDFALVRYNSDGSLDTTFSGDGRVTTAAGHGWSVTVQADGKILVAGASNNGSNDDFALARFNSDGTLDTTFSGDGIVTTAVGTSIDCGYSVAVQADGKILLAGYSVNGSNYDFALARYNSDGSLDSTFSGDGIVTTAVGPSWDEAYSVTVQGDGKILVAGYRDNGSTDDFALVRYNSDGSLDTTFSGDGMVATAVGTNGYGKSVTVQGDGKILLAGYSNNGDNSDFTLIRYNSDGSLDTTFSADGIVTTAIGAGSDYGYSVAVQTDGQILLAGCGYNGYNSDFALVRYNSDGSLDTTFSGDGIVTTAVGTGWDEARSVKVQADGKILVAGYITNGTNSSYPSGDSYFGLVRYNSDGSLDTTFDSANTLNGVPTYTENGSPVVLDGDVRIFDSELAATNYAGASLTLSRHGGASIEDLFSASGSLGALVTGGKLSVSGKVIGTVTQNSGGTLVLAFNSAAKQNLVNGALQGIAYSNSSDNPPASVQIDWIFSDGNAGAQGGGGALSATGSTTVSITAVNDAPIFRLPSDGIVTTLVGMGSGGRNVMVQADDKILVAGASNNGSNSDFALVRYNSDGSLDTTFSSDGMVTTAVGTDNDYGLIIMLQADGKILVLGSSMNGSSYDSYGSYYDFALVRYNSDGSLDTTFSGDGMVTTAVGTRWDEARSVKVQADGKILVAGTSDNGSGSTDDFALARYNSDGSLDTSFSDDGIFTTAFGMDFEAEGFMVQADGKILVAGEGWTGSEYGFALMRYNSDGSLDTTFSGNGMVTALVPADAVPYSVTVQADGKILVAGTGVGQAYFAEYGGIFSYAGFGLVRYNSDGSLDTTFSDDGIVITPISPAWAYAQSVTMQTDGKILVAGHGYKGNKNSEDRSEDFVLMRYNSDGSLDTSFSGDGIVTTMIGAGSDDYGYSVAVQADGKILVAGSSGGYSVLVRYNSDGSLDTTFDTLNTLDGTPTYTENGSAVVLDSDVQIFDSELSATNYAGASLTLSRHGGASIEDVFSASGSLGALTAGGELSVSGAVIGTVTQNSAGTLVLAFNSSSTQSLVNGALRGIAYGNSSDAPPASVQVDWTFSDGNTGAQGGGGAWSATGSTTVNITAVNDPPTGAVTIAGTATQGEVLSASNTLADDDGLGTIAYQWNANGTAISGATGSTYTLTQADVGKTITVTASYTDGYSTSESVTSAATASVSSGSNIITGRAGAEILNGTNGDDWISGLGADDTLNGNAGNDILDGGEGTDSLAGGTGDDLYLVDLTAAGVLWDTVTEAASAGIDTIQLRGTSTNTIANTIALGANLENLDASGTGSSLINLAGNALKNILIGNAAANVLTGGAGADTLDGGDGSDIYYLALVGDYGGDVIKDTGTSGTDELRLATTTASTLILSSAVTGIESIVIGTGTAAAAVTTGKTAININASALTDGVSITGNAGANSLIGGLGNDTLRGNAGVDTFNITAGTDAVLDLGSGGADVLNISANATVNATVTTAWTASASTVNRGTANLTTSGLAVNLASVKTAGSNGFKVTNTSATGTTLTGSGLSDSLTGGSGNDTLSGGAGADTLDGGDGSDIYYLALVGDYGGDVIEDSGTGGTDELRLATAAASTLILSSAVTGIESIVIGTGTAAAAVTTGKTAININASALTDGVSITGNAGANTLTGGGDNDTLRGNAGVDTFNITAGTDAVLDLGNGGADVLNVSAGATVNATVTTAWTASASTVNRGAATLTTSGLAVNLASVKMAGTNGFKVTNTSATGTTLTGSGLSDSLTGGSGNDTLTGGAGADTLDGGDGCDIYYLALVGDYGGDVIKDSGTGGTDELRLATAAASTLILSSAVTGIESIVIGTGTAAAAVTTGKTAININASALSYGVSITGNAGANTLTGGIADDFIIGNAGNDSIIGGGGNDTLTGGAGADKLDGGEGSDLYIIAAAAEYATGEVIADTGRSGSDELRFTSTAASTLTLASTLNGVESVVIGTGTGTTATTTGTTALNVNAAALAYGVSIAGNAGANALTGGSKSDKILGDAGNDILTGGTGADTLDGGDGADIYYLALVGDYSGDVIDDKGTSGTDELRLATTTASTLILSSAVTGVESIVIGTGMAAAAVTTGTTAININASALSYGVSITGNAGANTLTGGIADDFIIGNAGNDSIIAGGGNDTLTGGAGADKLDGGEGSDLYIIAAAAEYANGEIIADTGSSGMDELRFSSTTAGSLTLASTLKGVESVVIGTGTGTTAITTGTTALNVNAGALTYGVSITGNAGANVLTGSSMADKIIGNAGNDSIIGGGGNDTLIGGIGADLLTGGAGSDTFVFGAGDSGQTANTDSIADYGKGIVGRGDLIDYGVALSIGGSSATATSSQAFIDAKTGVATFAAGSGTTLSDALLDIAKSFTAAGDSQGEFAFFRVKNTGNQYLFISDGVAGVSANDLVVQLVGVSAISAIDLTGGNLTILA